jgi:large subunit ribosomal protein L35Ae
MGKEAEKQTTRVHKKTQPVRYVHLCPLGFNEFTYRFFFRLYQKAVFTGFKRGITTQYEQFALLKIKGVNDKKDTSFYFGKRVAYIYKAKNTVNNTRIRAIWGRIVKPHGNNGMVRAQFARNLPPRAMGATLRVMLFPNRSI